MSIPNVVAVIPARGGSKGIKKKNLQLVKGVSLIGRSIIAAKGCRAINRILVSTDCQDIASEARVHGAEPVERSEEIAGDKASSELAVLDCINRALCSDDDIIVFMQATSPFCRSEFLSHALDSFRESRCDSMSSVFKDHGFWWQGDSPMYDPTNRPMRQAQVDLYKEAGMFYIFRAEGIRRTGCRLHGVTKAFEIPKTCALEIDDYDDLLIARSLDM